ncbi:MAG: Glycosyl transferase, family 2 [Candidatus Peregrinibacteria bacterium GW2011_GWA2_47_7]|nr:MAG: Glycosyl transferase, family 2 [Candidatus Peregrinibacteria bacterium GW2011_GWA2_47_7]
MQISVVIPTYNRCDVLQRCLEALGNQKIDKSSYEVVVINDGSQDQTSAMLKNFQKTAPFELRSFTQENKGQGMARNFGVEQARGDSILFLGDDVFPDPDCLREHMRIHHLHPEENHGVLGFVSWHPELQVTPLMRFMTLGGAIFGKFGGHQFAYDLLECRRSADYRFFYTANISLKRNILLRHKFDPWFSGYGWEDIELGYRLEQKEHFVLHYNPYAVGLHYHPMNESDFERRMRAIGKSVHIFDQKYPELHKVPRGRKKVLLSMISSRPAVGLLKTLKTVSPGLFEDMYFYALSKRYFLEGLQETNKE